MFRVLTNSLTQANAKCENCHLCSINDHFSKTKAFCFISENPLDKLQYSLVFTKSRVFLWVENFRGLTAGFACLPTLSRTFIEGYICLTKSTSFFIRWGIYPYLLYPTHVFFHFLFLLSDCETHFGHCPILQSPPSNTKHSVDLYHELTPMSYDVPFKNAMQCYCMYLMRHAQ